MQADELGDGPLECEHDYILSVQLTTKKTIAFICANNCGQVKLRKRPREAR